MLRSAARPNPAAKPTAGSHALAAVAHRVFGADEVSGIKNVTSRSVSIRDATADDVHLTFRFIESIAEFDRRLGELQARRLNEARARC
jgi:hypothetical protein